MKNIDDYVKDLLNSKNSLRWAIHPPDNSLGWDVEILDRIEQFGALEDTKKEVMEIILKRERINKFLNKDRA